MPIRLDLRPFYRTPQWKAARLRVLERAGGRFDPETGRYLGGAKCEQCRKPDRTRVWVYATEDALGRRVQYWAAPGSSRWRDSWGARLVKWLWPAPGLPRPIWVVITVAHKNQTPGDDRPENLAALCQYCHLHWDRTANRDTRRARKDAARALLEAAR